VAPTDEAAREVEESRESYREWLSGPESFLAAVARHELAVGQALRFGVKGDVDLPEAGAAVTIAATDDGFRVDGFKRGPGMVRLGRYRLRLSHQNAPAVVVIDPNAIREPMAPRWFPYAPAYRFVLALEPDPEKIALESTRERDRAAERVGWFRFSLEGREYRVAATRLLEPGVPEDSLQIFFKDRTNGRESYQIGRYLDLDVLDDDGGSSDATGGDPVVTAPCGCLVLDDEWCRVCGGCRPRGTEWTGCCRCGVVTPDATDGGRS